MFVNECDIQHECGVQYPCIQYCERLSVKVGHKDSELVMCRICYPCEQYYERVCGIVVHKDIIRVK